MSKVADLDSTTKNVVQEIMRECTNKGIQVSENFVIYYVTLLMLNPVWGITMDSLPDRNCVQNFVKYCIRKLEDQNTPSIITLKMQFYFSINFDNIDNMITKNRINLKNRLAPLEKEVLQTETSDHDEICKLYKKIIYLITLYAGLGNPTIKVVYSEAEAAVQSVLSESDLKEFMADTVWNKELQIVELSELVTGIRLFNRDCQKGGAGIEDLPKLLLQAIEASESDIQNVLTLIMDNVHTFTTAIDNCFQMEQDEQENCELKVVLPEGVQEGDLKYIKDLLVVYRQYELLVRKILVEVGKIKEGTAQKCNVLQESLIKLHETVRFRIAIPTVQVFPLFCDVSHTWCELQDQTVSLAQLNQILMNLQIYIRDLVIDQEVLKIMVGPQGPITDVERLENTTGFKISLMDEVATVIDPVDAKEFDDVLLQYLGFCAWKFVETDGGLITGNPNMGMAEIRGRFYIFSSPEAAAIYGKNPTRYVLRGLNLARKKPELINLLQLKEQLAVVRDIEELVVKIPEVLVTYEADIQTDLHPIETKIDPNYMWNIWDWKRQAILYANLSRRLTRSTQTVKSTAWQAVRTQTHYTKDFIYQTKKDNCTNVPTLSNFIYGLRGRKDNIQHIITLTRPVDE